MTAAVLHLAMTLAWVAMTGSTEPGNVALGLGVTYLALWWARPLLGPTRYFEQVPGALGLARVFAWALLKSNLRVARDVIAIRPKRRTGIVAVPLDAESNVEITLPASLVTLTPGTLSLDVSTDRKVLYVHAMFIDDADEVRRSIKENFEQRILKLTR
ncbi:MAG: Na+/H+ antiporter subunit E [Phycisphaeraceae bacterium]